MEKSNILNFTYDKLVQFCLDNNLKPFVAKQIFDWIYKKNIKSFKEMTNIKKDTIELLDNNFVFESMKIIKTFEDQDLTTKFLIKTHDGNLIETVIMNFDYGNSLCVTTQVGCNMGCKFCASGQLKKIRNLNCSEIVNQLLIANEYLINNNRNTIRNIVVMGIGEPFDNYDNLKDFINIVRNDYATALGSRKITVSTCGLVNRFDDFINDFPQVGLAISLHAPNNEIRNSIMPINQAFNITILMQKALEYTIKTNRRLTFEYIMLDGINDSIECANQLVKLLEPFKKELISINLIPYNAVDNSKFKRSNNIRKFYEYLRKFNIITTVRQEKGNKINGACGQLRAKNLKSI